MRPLFTKVDIFSVVEHQKGQFKKAFQGVSNDELDRDTTGTIARLIEQFGINVPVLKDDQKYVEVRETQVDVSQDRMRLIRNRSQPLYVAGTEVKFVVPFTGDEALFGVRPPSFTLSPPFRQPTPTPTAIAAMPAYPPARRRASKRKKDDEWDVFISHATEDKEAIARPLADALRDGGLRVWYDEFSLTLGDSLRQSIDRGLARSLFGVVVVSPSFLRNIGRSRS